MSLFSLSCFGLEFSADSSIRHVPAFVLHFCCCVHSVIKLKASSGSKSNGCHWSPLRDTLTPFSRLGSSMRLMYVLVASLRVWMLEAINQVFNSSDRYMECLTYFPISSLWSSLSLANSCSSCALYCLLAVSWSCSALIRALRFSNSSRLVSSRSVILSNSRCSRWILHVAVDEVGHNYYFIVGCCNMTPRTHPNYSLVVTSAWPMNSFVFAPVFHFLIMPLGVY